MLTISKKLTERTVILAATAGVMLSACCAFGQSTEVLKAGVYPTEPGPIPQEHSTKVISQPILLPVGQPSIQVPADGDTITTPAPLKPGSTISTSAPQITPLAVPDQIKQPLTMQQAVILAFQNSPTIQSALARVENAAYSVEEFRAYRNPSVNARLTQSQQKSSAVSPSSTTSVGVSFALPLDISSQLKYSADLATMHYQTQYLSMLSTSEALIVDVKTAYLNLLRASGAKEVAQSAVDSARARLENIRAKFEEGTVPRFDVTTAEVELDNLNQALIAAQNRILLTQSSLNSIMGVNVSYPTQIRTVNIDIDTAQVDIPSSIEAAYAKRPDIKIAQTGVAASKLNITLQQTGQSPQLSITGGPSYNFNPIGNGSKSSWQIMAVVTKSIWDGGLTKARVNQAKSDATTSTASLEQAKIGVAMEVRSSALNMQEAALRTQTTSHAVALAEDALSIAQERYEASIAVLVEVTNAQTQLTQARFNYVNAEFDYAVAQAQLQRATSDQPELSQLLPASVQSNTSEEIQ